MFDEFRSFDAFDQAFSPSPVSGQPQLESRPLLPRKTWKQKLVFFGANLILLPLVMLIYLTIIAEGLRQLMAVFSTKLYKMPLPGAGLLREYDGWDRLDLAIIMSLLLFATVTFIWIKLFTALMGSGRLARQRRDNPVLFFLLATICLIILLSDIGIFWLGLESKASSGWGKTSSLVPPIASICYMAGLALLGAWHADYHTSGTT